MEFKSSTIVAIMASCIVLVQSLALPTQGNEEELTADKRPKYMETRRELSEFKDLLLFALDELIEEGKINHNVFADPNALTTNGVSTKDKRMRRLALCVQLTSSGEYKPSPCWKNSGR